VCVCVAWYKTLEELKSSPVETGPAILLAVVLLK